jgi:hypothetical protein
MFRILLIIGLLFAGATQGFARKVDVAVDDVPSYLSLDQVVAELRVANCCDETVVLQAKSTYCKSDCKGVIASLLAVPHNSVQVPDGLVSTRQSSVSDYLEPGPPKS